MKADTISSAGTLMNICAILSRQKKHQAAYQYALQAIVKFQASFTLDGLYLGKKRADKNEAASVVLAYYNGAVEAEHLQKWVQAQELYEFAHKVCLTILNVQNS